MKYHKQKNKKNPLIFLLSAVLACQPISASAVTFADINEVPFANGATSIQKAASLCLMVGEVKNGKNIFRPKDSVSLCETAQLAYTALLNTGHAYPADSITQKWKSLLHTHRIPDWAHNSVAFCLEKNIITTSELAGFMKNGKPVAATREQTATIFGRSVLTAVPTYSLSGSLTNFVDNISISPTARPYVVLLEKEGVLSGDNTHKFNPKNSINRTETAVIITSVYSLLSNGRAASNSTATPTASYTKSGTISALTRYYVNFKDTANYYYFPVYGSPVVFLNEKSSNMDKLLELFKKKTEMDATVTIGADNRISKIEVTCDENIKGKEVKGKVKSLSSNSHDEGKIKLSNNKTYHIEDTTDVIVKIDSRNKDFDDLADLYDEDETIHVTLTLDNDEYVTRIVATVDDDDDTVKGEITKLRSSSSEDDAEGEIELDDDDIYYIEDLDDIKIIIDNDDDTTFRELKDLLKEYQEDDDELEATLTLDKDDDDYVTKIKVKTGSKSSSDEDETEGEIDGISSTKIEVDGDSYRAKDPDDVEINVSDGDDTITNWDDLREAIEEDDKLISVTLILDDDYIIEIDGEVTEVEGILIDFDDDSLKLETNSGNKYTYDVKSSTKISFDDDDDVEDWDDFLDWLDNEDIDDDDIEEEDFTVTLTLKKDKVKKVEIDS